MYLCLMKLALTSKKVMVFKDIAKYKDELETLFTLNFKLTNLQSILFWVYKQSKSYCYYEFS